MKKNKIISESEIEQIIISNKVCSLSMISENRPYVLPMNFGYKNGCIYFHGASTGKKIDSLKTNPEVCVSFYFDEKLNIRNENVACSYSMKYKSVLAQGSIKFVEDVEEKKKVMNIIMKHYTGRGDFEYNKPAIENVSVFYLKPDEITAYKRGY